MKNLILCIIICIAATAANAQTRNATAYFGDTKINIPNISAMTECYSEPIIKIKAARLFNGRGMLVLGFYLPNIYYNKIDVLDKIPFDGYFLLYGQENMKNVKGGVDNLSKVAEIMRGSFVELDWNLDETAIEDKIINIGKPVLVEEYKLKDEVVSFLGLTYTQADNVEYIGTSIMNMMIVKGKLITMTGYFNYTGKDSVKKAKAKNDYVVSRFLDENK